MRLALALALASLPAAAAAPRDFPVTWTTRTASAGSNGFEAWVTPRLARQSVDWLRVDTRLAWVSGVTANLESQLSLDLDWERPDARTTTFDPRVSSLWRWTSWRQGSPVAVGGLGRLSLNLDSAEVEARLLVDATVGRALFAANGMASHRQAWNPGGTARSRLEASGGARFQVSSFAGVGLEVRGRSSFLDGLYQGTAVSVGPTLSLAFPRFWVALGLLAQVASDKATADKGNGEPAELRDNERFVLRLTVGQADGR